MAPPAPGSMPLPLLPALLMGTVSPLAVAQLWLNGYNSPWPRGYRSPTAAVEPMYDTHSFKVPQQSADYPECSAFVIQKVEAIITAAMDSGKNKILINTNLRLGLPMENINKIAGPFVEAWA